MVRKTKPLDTEPSKVTDEAVLVFTGYFTTIWKNQWNIGDKLREDNYTEDEMRKLASRLNVTLTTLVGHRRTAEAFPKEDNVRNMEFLSFDAHKVAAGKIDDPETRFNLVRNVSAHTSKENFTRLLEKHLAEERKINVSGATYVTSESDTLASIAERFLNDETRAGDLLKASDLAADSPDLKPTATLGLGERIILPEGAKDTAPITGAQGEVIKPPKAARRKLLNHQAVLGGVGNIPVSYNFDTGVAKIDFHCVRDNFEVIDVRVVDQGKFDVEIKLELKEI